MYLRPAIFLGTPGNLSTKNLNNNTLLKILSTTLSIQDQMIGHIEYMEVNVSDAF